MRAHQTRIRAWQSTNSPIKIIERLIFHFPLPFTLFTRTVLRELREDAECIFGGFTTFRGWREGGIEDLDLSADLADELLMQIDRRVRVGRSAVVLILLVELPPQAPPWRRRIVAEASAGVLAPVLHGGKMRGNLVVWAKGRRGVFWEITGRGEEGYAMIVLQYNIDFGGICVEYPLI